MATNKAIMKERSGTVRRSEGSEGGDSFINLVHPSQNDLHGYSDWHGATLTTKSSEKNSFYGRRPGDEQDY